MIGDLIKASIGAAVVLAFLTTLAFASERPSALFCWTARAAVATAGSEKAAEQAARDRGVPEETIAKAKRCKR